MIDSMKCYATAAPTTWQHIMPITKSPGNWLTKLCKIRLQSCFLCFFPIFISIFVSFLLKSTWSWRWALKCTEGPVPTAEKQLWSSSVFLFLFSRHRCAARQCRGFSRPWFSDHSPSRCINYQMASCRSTQHISPKRQKLS